MNEHLLKDRRRRQMLRTLSASALALTWVAAFETLAQGRRPPGLYRASGTVRVNGRTARRGQIVNPGDSVQTGIRSQAIFIIGQDAFLLRESSRVETQGSGEFTDFFRLTTGKLLSVFSAGQRRIETPTATIGIRGTGLYLEAQRNRTYACTCYGTVELAPMDMPQMAETVTTRHHEEPRYIYADRSMPANEMMPKAPVVNHTDAELTLLESLVGREPPFTGQGYTPY